MKHIKEYFLLNERISLINNYINESLTVGAILLYSLCAACASHYAIKGLKKISKMGQDFWNWAIDESLNDSQIIEGDNTNIDKSKIMPMQIPDEKILDKLMNKLKSDAKKKQGFYVFDKLFNETPELKKLNKAPYFANYVVFMDPGSDDKKDEKPNFYGMLGFSLKYWAVVAKKGKDEKIKEAASNLTKYINIFAVQTDAQYAKQGLFEVYIEDMKKAVKEVKMEGLTIKYEDDKLAETFAKYGFKKIEGLDHYMILSSNKQEE